MFKRDNNTPGLSAGGGFVALSFWEDEMGKDQVESETATLPPDLGHADLEAFETGKDEMNLAEFPIAMVAESARPGQLTLEFSDSIVDRSTGRSVDRRVTVHGTEEWGLPAARDDDVLIGLLQLCFLSGWARQIRFTRYQLCKLLRWPVGGASYRRIYQALHRLSTTTYNYRYGWRDKANQEWIPSLVFSYIQSLKIHEADRPTKSGLCEVTWSDDFHRSLEAGNLKGLDFERFVSLKSAISKRLYRFLDKRFGAGRSRYSCDLRVLAFEKIGISRNYKDAAQIKRLLRPAIGELEAVGFIAPARPRNRFEKLYRGHWRVHFETARRKKPVVPVEHSRAPIAEKLVELGVAPSEATRFQKRFPADYLEAKIDQFPYRRATSNPGGLLADSIRQDYPPPKDYLPPADRDRQANEDRKRALKRSKLARQKEARIRAEKAAEDRQRAAAKAVFETLSEEEKLALKRRAKRQFPKSGDDVIYWTMIRHLRDRLALD